MTKIRVTVYGVFHGYRFVTAFVTQHEAETAAAGIKGACQIVELTGKMEEPS